MLRTATVPDVPDDLAAAVAREVNRVLVERGMSVNALSKAAGLPVSTLGPKLKESTPMTLRDVEAVCAALDLEPPDLLRWALDR